MRPRDAVQRRIEEMEEAHAPGWLVNGYLLGDLVRLREPDVEGAAGPDADGDRAELAEALVATAIARGVMTREEGIAYLTGTRAEGLRAATTASERAALARADGRQSALSWSDERAGTPVPADSDHATPAVDYSAAINENLIWRSLAMACIERHGPETSPEHQAGDVAELARLEREGLELVRQAESVGALSDEEWRGLAVGSPPEVLAYFAARHGDRDDDHWRSTQPVWVQVTPPRFGWVWDVTGPTYEPSTILPVGTRFRPPRELLHGPPMGAYTCSFPPDDGRDDERWLAFTLVDGFGPLAPGAVIEMREATNESGLIAPAQPGLQPETGDGRAHDG